MSENKHPCLLCGMKVPHTTKPNVFMRLDCLQCGTYHVASSLAMTPNVQDQLKQHLAIATRQASEAGRPLELSPHNLYEIAKRSLEMPVIARLDTVLHHIAEKCIKPGTDYELDISRDYPLLACRDFQELEAYLAHWERLGYIQRDRRGREYGTTRKCEVTISGWEYLEPRTPPGGDPKRCFVAMWFDDSMDKDYADGIEKAIRDCNFLPFRVKEHPTNKSVIEKILAEIRRAGFLVADYTGHRPNVYYEAGFARGLGREVISCCKEGHHENLAFDTRDLGHIVWKDPADLYEKLRNSITVNIIPKS